MSKTEVDIIRKNMAACRKLYVNIASQLTHEEVASRVYRLRGDSEDEKDAPKAKAPVRIGSRPAAIGSRPVVNSDRITTLSNQLIWLRRAKAQADNLFDMRTIKTLRKEIDDLIAETSQLIDRSIDDKDFPKIDADPVSKTHGEAVEQVKKLFAKYVTKTPAKTTNLITYHNGVPFYTTMVIASDVKIGAKTYPKYILAVSESTSPISKRQPRKQYITHLADVQVKFEPRAQWKTPEQLVQITRAILAQHVGMESEGTKDLQPEKFTQIDGVSRSNILSNGSLKVQLSANVNAEDVIEEILVFLANEVKRTNPLYRGAITYKLDVVNKTTYVTFVAPMATNRPKFSESPVIRKKLKVTASIVNILNTLSN